jgi:pilus assembly protein CpaB
MQMKNTRAVLMLVVSVLMGLLAVFMTFGRAAQPGAGLHTVIVAAADMEPGSKLHAAQLSVSNWPQDPLPAGTFADVKDLQDRVLKSPVQRGEVILASKLAPVGSAGGLSAVIASGKRAMTVRVNDVVGVAGFALPGNYVDILVNAQQDNTQGGERRTLTKTVLEHVLVLAVAQEAGRDDTKPRLVNAVTLELSPADAEKIDLARNVGTLSLVLRNQVDKASVRTAGITKAQLLGDGVVGLAPPARRVKATPTTPTQAPLPVAEVNQTCVEVIQDGQRRNHCF